MRDEQDTARHTRAWLQDPVELDDRGLQAVLDRIPDTPQRSHRWLWPFERRPSGSGVTRTVLSLRAARHRRSLDMLNATRIAAVTAVLALTGSLALLAGPIAQPDDPVPVPAAETASTEVSHTPALFSGVAEIARGQQPETTALVDRLEMRGAGEAFTLEADDPRVDGSSGTTTFDFDDFPIGDARLGVLRAGAGRMENAGGSWALALVDGAWQWPDDGRSYSFATMVGEGGYEGLTGSILMIDYDGAGTWQVLGTIVPEEHVAAE